MEDTHTTLGEWERGVLFGRINCKGQHTTHTSIHQWNVGSHTNKIMGNLEQMATVTGSKDLSVVLCV